ncbi:mitochondria protoheme IX farnesyltransferase [Xylariaceae sp. FL1272]|nr:mitochondria protoheme IX farnesyltransferase [Xylariaceae sp. FL1272]
MRPAARAFLHVRILDPSNACRQCSATIPHTLLRVPAGLGPRRAITTVSSARLSTSYILSNNALDRGVKPRPSRPLDVLQAARAPAAKATTATTTPTSPNSPPSSRPSTSADDASLSNPATPELPHRQRQARRRAAASTTSETTSDSDVVLPAQDASSSLADVAASLPTRSIRRTLSSLLSLSKPRLTVLVTLTAMASYALYPVPSFLTPAITESPSLSPLTLFFLTSGTLLCSSAANSLNMLYEQATDAKMTRTRTRPLVRNLLSRRAAILFAATCALAGTGALYLGVNPTVSFLGAANIVLYAGVYTPLKAFTVANTWVGGVVGLIPPLMGWAAAAGESATADGSWRELLFAPDGSSLGGWILGGFLFAWQFPHFMALSWSIRDEYRAAGLRMLAWTNPARNARVALRYSVAFMPLCLALCAAGVTEWSFAVTSLPVNLWLTCEAVRFWRTEGHKGSARGLFWASIWYLPAVMVLALLQKKGMWQRVWRGIVGEESIDEEWDDELDEMPVVPTSTSLPRVSNRA